ncbi:MAG: hypothetical protein AYK23_01000 [Candidatus Proteinoplasmatales archaeon SG8-5]|nr:MAG: hypothetical protein AYK23_01000 [Candidatus Proteinoplasmatales archaeon SG8-5]
MAEITEETLLLLAIVTLIIIGVFSAILNYWMWSHWKRTMGITKQIEDDEILEPVSMEEPAPEPSPPPEPAPEPEEPRSEF